MILNYITRQISLPPKAVEATINLLNSGATVPFIARYRKEKTGNLAEDKIFTIQALAEKYNKISKRKESIKEAIAGQGKLTTTIIKKLDDTWNENEIEDIYIPFKKKRKTKADDAKDKGLEPLAKIIMVQREKNILAAASRFLTKDIREVQDAILGAQYIIAEWVSENIKSREILRDTLRRYGRLSSKVVKSKKEEATVYKDYWEYSEKLTKVPSHRALAILRGSKAGYLRIGIDVELERFMTNLYQFYIKKESATAIYLRDAIQDSVKRLIFPSVENQIIQETREKAEKEAIEVFAKNLRQLLLAPPLGSEAILALDPGFRTGCKLVCLDNHGKLLSKTTIFPHPPQNDKIKALATIENLLEKYKIKHIAIGNGTAGRETQEWLDQEIGNSETQIYLVNEDGASIYSASVIAREEFPNEDITVRGAISIGRRLIDPLSELVKIDPKSIGVGQYQHDLNPTMLKNALDQTVVSCVNQVGINLNTASKYLLQYISGLGPATAENIIDYRQKNGGFNSRKDLLEVARMGMITYEQAVGFVRIKNGNNPLDNTAIHPESYPIVEKIAKHLKINLQELIQNDELLAQIPLENFVTSHVGLPTLQDIIKELNKPGYDPRGKVENFQFDQRIRKMEDLVIGMIVPGVISNLTKFGAFVNIGLKNDGLIHISQISDQYIADPAQVLSLSQKVEVKIIGIDTARERINLSMKF